MRLGNVDRRQIAALADDPAVSAQVRVVAEQVLVRARDLVPVLTGALRDSLTVVESREEGHHAYRVGWDTEIAAYGPMVELGTINSEAQPHLRPAADEINRRR